MTALGILALAATQAQAANTPIYKCLDNHLGLVYTDLPCADGEKLDIRAGDADPVAVARLERVRDQLDQSAAQRTSDDRHAADQRALAERMRRDAEEDRGSQQIESAYAPFDYGYAVYPPFVRPHLHHMRPHQPPEKHGFAPSPPYVVPRP